MTNNYVLVAIPINQLGAFFPAGGWTGATTSGTLTARGRGGARGPRARTGNTMPGQQLIAGQPVTHRRRRRRARKVTQQTQLG